MRETVHRTAEEDHVEGWEEEENGDGDPDSCGDWEDEVREGSFGYK